MTTVQKATGETFAKWMNKPQWSFVEAAWLLAGFDPPQRQVDWRSSDTEIPAHNDSSVTAQRWNYWHQLMFDSPVEDDMSPADWLDWARFQVSSMAAPPPEPEILQHALPATIASEDEILHPRTRNTYLRAIVALAKLADVDLARHSASAGGVVQAAADAGLSMAKRTAEEVLKEAHDLVAAAKKAQ